MFLCGLRQSEGRDPAYQSPSLDKSAYCDYML
jgi:hypothetical protein